MNALKNKSFWLGFAVAAVALFIYEALSGQLQTNKAVFSTDSYV